MKNRVTRNSLMALIARRTCRAGIASVVGLFFALPTTAQDRSLFVSTITVGGQLTVQQTNQIRSVPDFYTSSNLIASFGAGYNPATSAVAAALDLRGLEVDLSFATNSQLLRVVIDGVIDRTFGPGTLLSRDQAIDEFESWLKADLLSSDPTLTALLQALVRESPVDPMAGNPNSLETRMFEADWIMSTRGPMTSPPELREGTPSIFSIGAGGGFYKACISGGCLDVQSVELPINHALNFDFNGGRWTLLMDLPLMATFTEGQWAVLASAALGVQYRPLDWWNVTVTGRFGGAGSIDVGALGFMYGVSFLNHMETNLAGYRLGMRNQFGLANTFDDIEIAGLNFSYDLSNQLLRNGAYVAKSLPWGLFGKPFSVEVFGSGSKFFGSALYMDATGEVGGAVTLLSDIEGKPYDFMRLAATYWVGRNYDGVNLRLDFRF